MRAQCEGKRSGGGEEGKWREVRGQLALAGSCLAEKDEEWLPCERGTSSVGGWVEQNKRTRGSFRSSVQIWETRVLRISLRSAVHSVTDGDMRGTPRRVPFECPSMHMVSHMRGGGVLTRWLTQSTGEVSFGLLAAAGANNSLWLVGAMMQRCPVSRWLHADCRKRRDTERGQTAHARLSRPSVCLSVLLSDFLSLSA